jgi:hypothetical protein
MFAVNQLVHHSPLSLILLITYCHFVKFEEAACCLSLSLGLIPKWFKSKVIDLAEIYVSPNQQKT